MSRRYQELDALRGIAVLGVLVSHYTANFDEFFEGHSPWPWPLPWGAYGVHLFFMISGFVILMTAGRHSDPADFAKARMIRLYPTYLISLCITVCIVFGSGFSALYRPWWEIVVNATMLQSFVAVRDFDGVYWSLAREIVFYCIIAMALWAFKRRIPHRFVIWFPLAWSAGGSAILILDDLLRQPWSAIIASASVAQYAPLFGIGMVMYHTMGERRMHPITPTLIAFAGINEALAQGWISGLIVVCIATIFVLIVLRGEITLLRSRPLLWLGAVSYPLYLLHQNIGYVIMGRVIDHVGPYMARVFAVAATLLLAWAVHALIELRLSRWIGRRLRPANRAQGSQRAQ